MRIKAIALDDLENPATITAEMTEREAALIARLIGPTKGADRQDIQSDGASVGSDIYDALTGVFNRFYDEGINGVPR